LASVAILGARLTLQCFVIEVLPCLVAGRESLLNISSTKALGGIWNTIGAWRLAGLQTGAARITLSTSSLASNTLCTLSVGPRRTLLIFRDANLPSYGFLSHCFRSLILAGNFLIPWSTFFACPLRLASLAILQTRQALVVVLSLTAHILPLGASLDATLPRFEPAWLTGPTSVRGNTHFAMWAARLASARLVICQEAFRASEVYTRWSVLCISIEIVPRRANCASTWRRTYLAPLGTHSTLPSFFIKGLGIRTDYFTLSASWGRNCLLLAWPCSFIKFETWFASSTIWSLFTACSTRTITLLTLTIDCREITLTAYQFRAHPFIHPVIWKALGADLWSCALHTTGRAVLALPTRLPGTYWALRNTFHASWVSVAPLVLSLLASFFPALRWAVWIACNASLILPIRESPQRASSHAFNGAVIAFESQVPGLALTAIINGRAWGAPTITFLTGLTWRIIILP
jgi:hypothetical protein